MALFLHRVALGKPGMSRWMASTQPFLDPRSKLSLKPVRDAELLNSNPCQWKDTTQNKLEDNEVEVAYSQLLAPIPSLPPFAYGLGLNYASHSEETKMPLPKLPIVIGKAP